MRGPVCAGLARLPPGAGAPRWRALRAAPAQQHRHQRLLDVEAVLRLVPDPRLGAFEHALRHFLATVRGEAMEKDGAGIGAPHERVVHHVPGEGIIVEKTVRLCYHNGWFVLRMHLDSSSSHAKGVFHNVASVFCLWQGAT